MGKFVDKIKEAKNAVKTTVQKFELKKDKLFKELVERVATLETALNEISTKLEAVQAELKKAITKETVTKEEQ